MKVKVVERKLILENDAGEEISFSSDEVAGLVLNSRAIFRLLTSVDQTGRYSAVPTLPATHARIAPDAHHSSAVLILTREDDEEDGFLLSLETSKSIRDQLNTVIDLIETNHPSAQ